MQAGLCADVHRDVGVEGQVLPRDYLIFNRVHPIQPPGLPRLSEHVEPEGHTRSKGS